MKKEIIRSRIFVHLDEKICRVFGSFCFHFFPRFIIIIIIVDFWLFFREATGEEKTEKANDTGEDIIL